MSFGVSVVTVGKPQATCGELVERYRHLLRPYTRLSLVHTRSPGRAGESAAAALAEEARRLKALIPAGAYVVALGEEGKERSSREFAAWVQSRREHAHHIAIVVGGAHGLARSLVSECAEIMSLSRLTLPHDLALVVLMEQLYRAFTILQSHPYHK